MKISSNQNLIQFIRYGIVGLFSNALGYTLFLVLTQFGVEPKLAMTYLYVASTTLSYIGNWQWTFKRSGSFSTTSYRFILTHIIGYTINYMMLAYFVDKLHYSYQWVQAFAILVVSIYVFIAFKFFVFFKKPVRGNE